MRIRLAPVALLIVLSSAVTFAQSDYRYFLQYTELVLPNLTTCPTLAPGDMDGSGQATATDAIVLVNYIYGGGMTPFPAAEVGDMNCNGVVRASDVITLINYLFRGGLPPCDPCEHGFTDTVSIIEAEAMAIDLLQVRIAPDSLKWRIYHDLQSIRGRWGALIPPGLWLRYFPLQLPSAVRFAFDDATFAQIQAGTYTAWDSLNSACDLYTYRTSLPNSVNMTFEGIQLGTALCDQYAALPGLTNCRGSLWAGDWASVYPYRDGEMITYLFRDAWGDCPAGCIYSNYWYFRSHGASVEYVGFWDAESPPPNWWAEADRNLPW